VLAEIPFERILEAARKVTVTVTAIGYPAFDKTITL
jgi:hypothetical protein